jgi:hypothetical protein
MTIIHFFLIGRHPFFDQLRGVPLKINQVPSGRQFQRREFGKSRDAVPEPRCELLSILPKTPNSHKRRIDTKSDCSGRMIANHMEEQRPSVLEMQFTSNPALCAIGINSNADDFITTLSRVSIPNSRLKSIGITQSPKIIRSIFRSDKNRTHFALWREHTQCNSNISK